MLRYWHAALRGGLVTLLGATLVAPLCAETPTQRRRAVEELVTEAQFHASLGLNDERARLLSEAEQTAPEVAALRWAQGQVKHHDRWVDIESMPDLVQNHHALIRYEQRRDSFDDTAAGQLALARYCQRNRLTEQARAHLVRVLEHEPNHTLARRELGFVRVQGEWLHQDDVALAGRLAAEAEENFRRWQKRILDIRHDLTARAQAQRAAAAERLAAIDDPAAVPAIETLLGYASTEIAEKAVAVLGQMTAPEATLALARLGVHAPAPEVRAGAAKFLQGRPLEQYVPSLLSAMTTTIEARTAVVPDGNGRLVHQQIFVREDQNQQHMLVRGTEYRRQYTGNGDQRFAQWQASLDIARSNATGSTLVALQNLNTQQRNERITEVLATATEQRLGNDPREWWSWWNEYNDMKFDSDKPVSTQVAYNRVAVLDGIPTSGGSNPTTSQSGSGSGGGGIVRSSHECLVAGTPVRTHRGDVAIEQVRVGDLVLSQDVNTGELAYKPVLKTTITPEGPLVQVEAGEGLTFRSTRGHLFWVSGEGWKQAHELRSGMQLHTPRGTVAVSHVSPAKSERTFNLVVADFHTYFAGKDAVLSHDNTLRRPTQAIIPGVVSK